METESLTEEQFEQVSEAILDVESVVNAHLGQMFHAFDALDIPIEGCIGILYLKTRSLAFKAMNKNAIQAANKAALEIVKLQDREDIE